MCVSWDTLLLYVPTSNVCSYLAFRLQWVRKLCAVLSDSTPCYGSTNKPSKQERHVSSQRALYYYDVIGKCTLFQKLSVGIGVPFNQRCPEACVPSLWHEGRVEISNGFPDSLHIESSGIGDSRHFVWRALPLIDHVLPY